MPYNTRRKSLSLPALGIALPNTSRAHRLSVTKPVITPETPQPPSKRIKRSHPSNSPSPTSPSRPRSSTTSSTASKTVTFADRPKSSGRTAYEHTPPPSPGASNDTKIDTDAINDDIVTRVIEQLEKTGNRPHLIKELAAVLSTTSEAVASSANPTALLSSRLAAYLRRNSWTTQSPCPLYKELVPIHPRQVYYFLTTVPRQEIPADSSDILSTALINTMALGGKSGQRIISPSLSNASVDEDADAAEVRKREAISPSPEIDLSAPELDEMVLGADSDYPAPPTRVGLSFSGHASLQRDSSHVSSSEALDLVHNHRAASPPLEGDEREFTQTASSMRLRGLSLEESAMQNELDAGVTVTADSNMMQVEEVEETDEERVKRSNEAAAALFGPQHQHGHGTAMAMLSSPLIKDIDPHPVMVSSGSSKDAGLDGGMGDNGDGFGWDLKKPENVDLDELEDLFGGF